MTIGEYIRSQRVLREWSLEDLARRSGLTRHSILGIEGNVLIVDLPMLESLGKAFKVGAGDLLVAAGYTITPLPVKTITLTIAGDVLAMVSEPVRME